MKSPLIGCLAVFCLTLFSEDGIVSAVKCPVYINPDFTSQAVFFLTQGQRLSYHSKGNGWGIMALPENAPVWTAACFCKDGVFCDKPIFRTGPSAANASYLFEGNAVGLSYTVIDTAEKGFWLKIRPIPGLFAFFPLEGVAKGKTDSEKTIQGNPYLSRNTPYSAEGKLTVLQKPVLGASHQLTLEINHRNIPVAYINPGNTNLQPWTDRQVIIHGYARWSRKSSLPFLEAEKIAPSWN